MSCAAIMLVKDEADVLEHTIRHLHSQVDEIIVSDNNSTDGTRDLLEQLAGEGLVSTIYDDPDPAYFQSAKTTWLAERAREFGMDWVLPVDADERWRTFDGRPIREHLLGIAPDVQAINGVLYHYIPSVEDDGEELDPFRRIVWRLAEPAGLPKVGARTLDGLSIDAGNHGVKFHGHPPALAAGGLRVDHFSWRSESQFGRKIRNGARAYAATDLPEGVGPHWRMWGNPDAPDLELRAAAHFRKHFLATDPPKAPGMSDPAGLIRDPVVE